GCSRASCRRCPPVAAGSRSTTPSWTPASSTWYRAATSRQRSTRRCARCVTSCSAGGDGLLQTVLTQQPVADEQGRDQAGAQDQEDVLDPTLVVAADHHQQRQDHDDGTDSGRPVRAGLVLIG